MKPEFWDNFDKKLTKAHLMHPLVQFNRYLHRHDFEHTHPMPNLIIRKTLPKKVEG